MGHRVWGIGHRYRVFPTPKRQLRDCRQSRTPVAHGGNHASCSTWGDPKTALAPQDRAGSPTHWLLLTFYALCPALINNCLFSTTYLHLLSHTTSRLRFETVWSLTSMCN